MERYRFSCAPRCVSHGHCELGEGEGGVEGHDVGAAGSSRSSRTARRRMHSRRCSACDRQSRRGCAAGRRRHCSRRRRKRSPSARLGVAWRTASTLGQGRARWERGLQWRQGSSSQLRGSSAGARCGVELGERARREGACAVLCAWVAGQVKAAGTKQALAVCGG